jgi:Lrp/AsnC family transcriptional regulator, leucine-responsive regulatory protein
MFSEKSILQDPVWSSCRLPVSQSKVDERGRDRAFVLIEADAWMGDTATRDALAAIPEIQETHIVAGPASLLAKIRAATTEGLQDVLRRIFAIEGVTGTNTIVVLETAFERPLHTGAREDG